MQLTKATIGLVLGLGLIAGACGGDDKPSSSTERQPSPPAARQQAAVGDSPAEIMSKQLAPSYPDASASQVDCLSNGILDQLGQTRFNTLVAIGMAEKAGVRAESARSAQEVADFEKIRTLAKGCGLSVR